MMSNKWAFSLTTLITIFAFAFVVTPAMAELTISLTNIAEFTPTGANEATPAVENPPDADTVKDGHQLRLGITDPPVLTITVMTDVVLLGTLAAADTTDKLVALQTVTDSSTSPATVTTTVATLAAPTRDGAMGFTFTVDPADNTTKIEVSIPADTFGKHAATSLTIEFLGAIIVPEPVAPADPDRPMVVSIQRLRPGSQTVVAAFQEAEVTGPFDVRIVLTEKGHDFKVDHINVTGGTASGFVNGAPFPWFGTNVDATTVRARSNATRPFTVRPHPIEGMYQHNSDGVLAGVPMGEMGFVPLPTGDDNMYYQYRVTITPHRRASMVKVSVKEFHDNDSPYKNYYQPVDIDEKPNGREELRLTVNIPLHDLEAGYRIYLPHEEGADFPKDGHYILARNKMGSFINYSNHEGTDTPDRENKAKEQTLAQLKFNVRETVAGTPASRARTADEPQFELPNLEAFLANNGHDSPRLVCQRW